MPQGIRSANPSYLLLMTCYLSDISSNDLIIFRVFKMPLRAN